MAQSNQQLSLLLASANRVLQGLQDETDFDFVQCQFCDSCTPKNTGVTHCKSCGAPLDLVDAMPSAVLRPSKPAFVAPPPPPPPRDAIEGEWIRR